MLHDGRTSASQTCSQTWGTSWWRNETQCARMFLPITALQLVMAKCVRYDSHKISPHGMRILLLVKTRFFVVIVVVTVNTARLSCWTHKSINSHSRSTMFLLRRALSEAFVKTVSAGVVTLMSSLSSTMAMTSEAVGFAVSMGAADDCDVWATYRRWRRRRMRSWNDLANCIVWYFCNWQKR